MTEKYTCGDYTVFVTFKSQNTLSIIATNNKGLQTYGNQIIQLTKIKKDTVVAALQRKSEKNISSQFSYQKVQGQEKPRLILTIKVKYDFLPQFKEDISLMFMKEKDETIIKIQSVSFQNDINQIQRMLDCLQKASNNPYTMNANLSYSEGNIVTTLKVQKGKYLLQMSGFCNSPQGVGTNGNMGFSITHSDGQKLDLPSFKPYITSSYSYPYSLSEVIQVKKSGDLVVRCKGNVNNINVQNNFTIITPVIDLQ